MTTIAFISANRYHLLIRFTDPIRKVHPVQAQSSHSQKVLSHPSLDQGGSGASAHITPSPAQLLQSSELLKGQKTIGILHNGSLYRLQATKLGKLILTK